MTNYSRLRKFFPDEELSALDSYLQRVLIPVFPSQVFVQDLQSRLLGETVSPDALKTLRLLQFMLATTGILAGISILMITGIRVVIGFLTLLGLIQNFRNK